MKSPEPRFFIDHNVIHDRLTGRHVTTDVELESPNWPGINDCLRLLNELAEHAQHLASPGRLPAAVLEVLKMVESSWVDGYDGAFEDGEVPAMDAVRAIIKAAEQDKATEPQNSLWPIAGIEVRHGKLMSGSLYAPGLPEGWHDVYPCAVHPGRSEPAKSLPTFTMEGCMRAAELEEQHGDIAWPMGAASGGSSASGNVPWRCLTAKERSLTYADPHATPKETPHAKP